jgi:hypothetical protein
MKTLARYLMYFAAVALVIYFVCLVIDLAFWSDAPRNKFQLEREGE